ncbi:imidazole glycerol phosphate synthase subunit HisH [Parerythrobacter jejuensis]|uniref:imidazole glycerol phosphate synthase subunit HisH n=1 Tax=Parerythrobacter jejuensis TaxID=795812 RepID=UPI002D802719|nr:imidazole glycerol phosphate synthase subunit HisH [Parerythrobacter jejuensis]
MVDYGLGNVQAFLDIFKRLNIPAKNATRADELAGAERIILPGVGAFDRAMERLQESGMREALDEAVIDTKVPVLGVCVGMQMMADRSEEGECAGLGWIPGQVKRFDESSFNHRTHLPHMGWNDVTPASADGLFVDLPCPRFYFLHSYHFVPESPEDALAQSTYGIDFTCALRKGNVFGTQFHPEKSHHWGVSLLANFARI